MIGIGPGVGVSRPRGLFRAIQAMFAAGEKGVIYDPSDFTTLFQDSAGTTAVTAAGQPVGLMLDKSQGLVLGPELVTNGTFDTSTTGWSAALGSTISNVSGEVQIVASSTNNSGAAQTISGLAVGTFYKASATIRRGTCVDVVRFGVNGIGDTLTNSTTNVDVTYVFKATATSHIIQVVVGGTLSSGQTAYADNISVKELPGYHATQPTSTARPILGRHPITGRRNLLTYTEDFSNVIWAKQLSTVTANTLAAPDGSTTADTLTLNDAPLAAIYCISYGPFTATMSIWVRVATGTQQFKMATYSTAEGQVDSAFFTATTEWQRFSWTRTVTALSNWYPVLNGESTAKEFYIWGAQLELGSTPTAYQKVVSTYDVTEAGVNDAYYLKFDGVDDFMVTPSIDFTAADKMSVFAGVRKLSDATIGAITELSTAAGSGTNLGTFVLHGQTTPVGYRYAGGSNINGTAFATDDFSVFTSPITNVISVVNNFAGSGLTDEISVRVNGVIPTQTLGGTVSTGNYGNYPLYLGMRAGTSLPFNGHLYGLIVRGALSDAAQITAAEAYANSKTGAY